MSVEYRNMDMDDSKATYKRLWIDTNKLRFSVYSLKQSPFRLATVCLGVLCILLLAALIGQSVSYRKVQQENTKKLQAVNADKDGLQKSLNGLQNEQRKTEERQRQLEQTVQYYSTKRNQMQSAYDSLAQEMNKAKLSEGTLKSTNAALTKALQQLNVTATKVQNDKNALAKAKDMFQVEFNQAVQLKTTLEENYRTVTAERNNLQNRFNNVSRFKDQLQQSYNGLMMRVETLEKRLHVSTIEKDQAETSHMNVTAAKSALQDLYDILVKGTEQLNSSYNNLLSEKQELEKSSGSIQAERDTLLKKNGNLTAERDQLQVEVTKLNATIADRSSSGCNNATAERMKQLLQSLGWVYFGGSVYLDSNSKRSWQQTRQFCQNKGADLIIINSRQEQEFAHSKFKENRWIGLNDRLHEGEWRWVDGSSLVTSFWESGEPNNHGGDEDCVEMDYRKGSRNWNDVGCNEGFKGICEFSLTQQ